MERRDEGVELVDASSMALFGHSRLLSNLGHFDRGVVFPILNIEHLFKALNQPRLLHRVELPPEHVVCDQEAPNLPRYLSVPSAFPVRSLRSETVPPS